ncbi:MAG: Acetyltransferase involved in cellulose biosynthesis, CelD/BcsL family [Chloroflexi bacterium]|nr:MAG: Acetyltransferase involved in cellulose biosynthesis, CelD/BcsL family [Chloroflexota bacterium]
MSLTTAPAEWDRLAPEWAALHAQVCPPAGAFATPHFQSAWWQAFADRPPPDHPCTLQLHSVRAGDELVGVLPLMRDDGLLRLIGNADVCDYMDLLAAAGRESEVADALLDHLDDCAATDLLLPGLPPTSWALALLPSAATARGWDIESQREAVCPVIPLATGWDAYLDVIKTRHRREVRRKMRNLLDGGAKVALEAIDSPDALHAALPEFLALMAASRGDKAEFLTEQMSAFFHGIVESMAPPGLLRLYFFHVDAKRVAAVLCFLAHGELQMYNSGYDPEYRELSVGLASKVFIVRDAIERGLTRVNFLRGEEPYKFQLGAKPTPVTTLRLRRPTPHPTGGA